MMNNEELIEKLIIQTMWLERFKGETPQVIRERLEKASKAISSFIIDTDISTKSGFRELNKFLTEQMTFVYGDFDSLLFDDMKELTEVSYNATTTLINTALVANSLEPNPKFKDIKKSTQEKLLDFNRPLFGSTLPQIKDNNIVSSSKRLRETIKTAYDADSALSQAQRAVRAIEQKDLIIGSLSRHQLDTVTNTALKSAIEESKGEAFDANTDVIIGWRDLSVMDSRVSDQCRTLDNSFYPIKKYPKWSDAPYPPPSHPNCRRMRLPETIFDQYTEVDRAFTETTTRTVNHRDGTTSTAHKVKDVKFFDSKFSFNDLFSKQSKSFQKDYLGEQRYQLYKKYGDKVLKEMYSLSRNKRLTLTELRSKLGE